MAENEVLALLDSTLGQVAQPKQAHDVVADEGVRGESLQDLYGLVVFPEAVRREGPRPLVVIREALGGAVEPQDRLIDLTGRRGVAEHP